MKTLTWMEPYEVVTIAQGVDGLLDVGEYLTASAYIQRQTPGEVLHCYPLASPDSGRSLQRIPVSQKL